MNHSFPTFRGSVEEAESAISICKAVQTVMDLTTAEHQQMKQRKEGRIKDADKRECITLHAPRLGLLLEDLSLKTAKASQIPEKHAKTWASLLESRDTDTKSLRAAISELVPHIEAELEKASVTELDDGSSSCSDYSDSRTSSSSSSSGRRRKKQTLSSDEGEDSDEESEEEEEKKKKPTKKR